MFFAIEECAKDHCDGAEPWVSALLLLAAVRSIDLQSIVLSRATEARAPDAQVGRLQSFGELLAAVAIAALGDMDIRITDRPTAKAIKVINTGGDAADLILSQIFNATIGAEDPARKHIADSPLSKEDVGVLQLWFKRRQRKRQYTGLLLDLSACPVETLDSTLYAVAVTLNTIAVQIDSANTSAKDTLVFAGTRYSTAELNRHLSEIYALYCLQPEPKP